MTVSPAIALCGAIIALQFYTIVYLHQMSLVCHCGNDSVSTGSSIASGGNTNGNASAQALLNQIQKNGSLNGAVTAGLAESGSSTHTSNAMPNAGNTATPTASTNTITPSSSMSSNSMPSPPTPASATAVRPSSQKPIETAKSTKDLLNELSNIRTPQKTEVTVSDQGSLSTQQIQTQPPVGSITNTVTDQIISNNNLGPIVIPPGQQPQTTNMRVLDFLNQMHPQGIGVVLGIGRNPFVFDLLQQWRSSPGLYLCDPFIHIWQGYDDPSNVSDKENQMIFEDLRNKLVMYEGRYSIVRDFSSSFAVTFKGTSGSPPVSIVWVDNNPNSKAVERDLSDWFVTLAPGGIIAGPRYNVDSVKGAVHAFAAQKGVQVGLFQDANVWFIKNQQGQMGMR